MKRKKNNTRIESQTIARVNVVAGGMGHLDDKMFDVTVAWIFAPIMSFKTNIS